MAANCADSCGVCKGAPSRGYWLGMQRSPGQRLYSWSDRSPVTYTLWHKGEPSALENTGGSCVGLYVPINQMNDGSCSDILDGYVCKQPMQRLSNASAIDNSLGCNGTQLAYKDMCFKYIHSPMTWNKAKTYCETTERGSLVVIKNRYVQAFVASELHNQIEDVWIGLSINGSLPSKLQWAAADHHIRFTNLEAADINSLGNTGCFALQQKKPIGLWKEYNCSTKLPFLCQKLRNGFSTAPAMPTVPTTNVATKCDDSWTQFQGVCYKLSSRDHGLKTWSVANDICTHYGGNLVYIGSQDVQNFIYSFVNGDIFLGLHDKGNEGVFAWSNGKPMVYTNWVSGEPNNYGVNEDCASMVKYNGQWNDDSCHTTKAFVCEIPLGKPVNKEAVPDFSKLEECNTTSYGNSNMKWYRHQAFCYYVETQASNFKTWSLAQDFCNSVHGNLASIDSEGTNDFLTVMVAQSVNRETWIGLWKNDVNGKFKWKDGSSVQFAAWHPGTSISKSCIMIKNDGLWIDGHCNSKGPFICKRPLVPYTTNTTVLPSTSAASSGGCEVGYWQFGSKCYGISDPSGPLMTSDLAFANCRRQRGELLTIDSVDEQVFVSSILIGQHHGVWTSMTRWSDGAFKWGGQRVVHFTNWAPGEPSYTRAGMSHENCVELLIRPDMLGRWNDVSCDAERGYICTKALDSSLPPQTAAPSECPHGYSGFTDTCIRHVTSSKQGFVDSQRVCAELGGRVMTVDSEAYNPYSLLKSLSSEGQVWVNYAKNSGSGCFVQTVDTIKQNLKGCTEALTVLCETERLGRTTTPKPTIPPNTTTCHGEHSVRIEQRCFALFKTKLQFHVTLEACTKLGMAPASIHSDTQNQQLIDWINTQNMSLSEFWIGLMDMFGQPLWIDSTSMDYRGAMVMVNYYGSSYVLEKCGYVTTGQYSWFITSDCTEERAFLCADITGDNNGTFVPEEITSSYIYSEETSSVDTSDDARPTYYPINRRYHGGPPDSKAAAPSSLSAGQIAAWVIGACALVACIGAVVYRLRCSSLKAKLLSATKRSDLGFDNALFQKDGDETVMLE
ncbi:hypothetical protein DPMN_077873 [Dreissena polymorpha]|uniref:C-type lectin domain-containing protein n=2 Tax=Dreissena polymorpha TaxID=45954 RepID=A0A9D3YL91_DREPO|nr:hypothetical protein DPMN_077873 [Dreissena polymorpha]